MDSSRPLTFASHHMFKDLCLDLVDIISFNIYPGWYFDEDPGIFCDRIKQWSDEAGGKGKPMIISEFGGDGFYGFRSPLKVKGSEERQVKILSDAIESFMSREYIKGMLIWQFCDCRVTEEDGWAIKRAMTRNSKGIVDEYRRPKLAYETVSQFFHSF